VPDHTIFILPAQDGRFAQAIASSFDFTWIIE
jgi:hypothetical protein